MIPVSLDKTATHIDLLADGQITGRGNRRKSKSEFPFPSGINVAFNGQGILRGKGTVNPKASAEHVPAVRPVLAGEVQKLIPVEILCIDTVIRPLAPASS